MKTDILENGRITGALYEKPDGTYTTKGPGDVMALNLSIIMVGSILLGLLSHLA
jgi:hypothetical protein